MAHGLEIRSPFLDHKLMEITAKLPLDLKINYFNSKYLLKQIALQYFPADHVNRKKHGFSVPLARWLRHEMAQTCRERLLSRHSATLHLFKPDQIQSLIAQHLSGQRDYARRLWSLLMLESWWRQYIS